MLFKLKKTISLKKSISLSPFTPKSNLIDFTLSNAGRFYSSKGDPLGVKGLKNISLNPFTPKNNLINFTLSDARRFYSTKGDPLGVKGLIKVYDIAISGIFKAS